MPNAHDPRTLTEGTRRSTASRYAFKGSKAAIRGPAAARQIHRILC